MNTIAASPSSKRDWSLYGIKKVIFSSIIFFCFFVTPWLAVGKEIVWMKLDFPPLYILNGESKGQGYTDRIIQFMIENLPDYQHEILLFPNYLRMEREAANGLAVCDAAAFYIPPEERQSGNWLYSAPHTVFFLPSIIIRTSDKPNFSPIETLSELVNSRRIKLGVQAGRPFGARIDAILASKLDRSHIIVRSAQDYVGLYGMLRNGSVDYVIDYYPQAVYAAERLNIPVTTFSLVPIQETQNQYSFASIRCQSDMDSTISDINQVLVAKRDTSAFHELTKRWGVREPNPILADKIYTSELLKIRK